MCIRVFFFFFIVLALHDEHVQKELVLLKNNEATNMAGATDSTVVLHEGISNETRSSPRHEKKKSNKKSLSTGNIKGDTQRYNKRGRPAGA